MSADHSIDASVLKAVRNRLSETAPGYPYASARFLVFQGCFFLCTAMAYVSVLLASPGSLVGMICYCLALAGCLLQAASLGHQGFHQALVPSKVINDLIAYTSFLFSGVDGKLWRLRHMLDHHPHTNVHGHDNDLDSPTFLRLAPYTEWRWYHRYQPFYAPLVYSSGTVITIFYSDWFCLKNAIERGVGFKSKTGLIAGFIARKAFFVAVWFVIPLLLVEGLTLAWVTAYFLIASVPVAWLLFPIGMAHMNDHAAFYDEPNAVDFAELQIETTVDFCPNNRMMTLLYGGLNSHLAHHLFPKVASCHHVKLYATLREQAPEVFSRKIDLNLVELYRSHFRYLKKLSKPIPHPQASLA
jgi:linoleoyl-CoA desaturase